VSLRVLRDFFNNNILARPRGATPTMPPHPRIPAPLMTAVAAFLLLPRCARAQTTFALSPLFGPSMVLQRGAATAVFGTSAPGDVVSVSLNGGAKTSGTADVKGRWTVVVAPGAAGSVSNTVAVTSTGGGAATLSDVAFGDVFVVLGEGNALMGASAAFDAAALVAQADALAPTLRLFQAGCAFASCPPALPWTRSSAAVVGAGNWTTFSALGFSFAAALAGLVPAASAVPVGVVVAGAGGSPLEAWAGPATLAACPNPPPAPRFATGALFDALVRPAAQLSLAGVLLWQGETNANLAVSDANTAWWACAMPAFAAELRSSTGLGASGFLGVVQLPPVGAQFWTDAVPMMRASQQALASASPPTAVVMSGDLGDLLSPFTWQHGRNKTAVAQRLARAAAALVYGVPGLRWTGPSAPAATFISSDPTTNISTVTVTFDAASVGAGLFLDSAIVCPAGMPEGDPNNLWISYSCGAWRVRTDKSDNERWYNAVSASVSADGKSVAVTVHLPRSGAACPPVEALQYAFAPWPAAALHDLGGNPAWPFEIPIAPAAVPAAAPAAKPVLRAPAVTAAARTPTLADPEVAIPTGGVFDRLLEHRRVGGRRLQSWLQLEPQALLPLPLGSVTPKGWLAQQLQVEAAGMAGYLDREFMERSCHTASRREHERVNNNRRSPRRPAARFPSLLRSLLPAHCVLAVDLQLHNAGRLPGHERGRGACCVRAPHAHHCLAVAIAHHAVAATLPPPLPSHRLRSLRRTLATGSRPRSRSRI